MVFISEYKFRKKLTIDNAKVLGASAHLNFPVYIQRIVDIDLKSSSVQSLGQDIRFTAADGITVLDFEIASFSNNANDGTLHAFVKIPSLSNSVDTVIYLYYGNPIAIDGQNKNAVWDSNHLVVYHLNETSGGVDAIKDSTNNNNHGTDSGSPTFNTPGKLGNGVDFDGINDFIMSKNNIPISGDSPITFEFWTKADGNLFLANYCMGSFGASGPNNLFAPSLKFSGKWVLSGRDTEWDTLVLATLNLTHHFITHVSGQSEWYVNGVKSGIGDSHVYNIVPRPLTIGRRGDGIQWYNGILDEVRVSNIARSSDWGITSFNNQNSPSTFYVTGIQEIELILGITKVNIIRNDIKNRIIRSDTKNRIIRNDIKIKI